MNEKDDEISIYYSYFLTALLDLSHKRPGSQETKGKQEFYYCFDEMCENFLSSCRNVLQWPELKSSQGVKLQKLFDTVDDYSSSLETPQTDSEIAKDPKWQEIRKYAQEVYDELKNIKIDT